MWCQFPLFTLCAHGYYLHVRDHSGKRILVVFDLFPGLMGRQKYEFGVNLTCTTLHLDEGFDSHELVEADDLVAGGDVQAFFDHIGGD